MVLRVLQAHGRDGKEGDTAEGKVMNGIVGLLATIVLTGCTLSKGSGVLKLGPDTYTTSAAAAPAGGGPSEARRVALTEANEHCQQLGKEIMVVSMDTAVTNIYGAGKAEVVFRCLSKGDPELQRPEIKQTPGVTIEDRRR
jgi:hypothetical protein